MKSTAARHHRRPHPARQAWIGLAALALLLAQTFALLHGVVHPHAGTGWAPKRALLAAAAVRADAAAPLDGQPFHAAAPSLAHHDDGSALCRLIDHLAQADALPAPPPALLPPAEPETTEASPSQGCTLASVAHYEARAPPITARS